MKTSNVEQFGIQLLTHEVMKHIKEDQKKFLEIVQEVVTKSVEDQLHTFKDNLKKEIYTQPTDNRGMTLDEFKKRTDLGRKRFHTYNLMLALAKKDRNPDTCLWTRLGFPPEYKWVCLTNPASKLERHFVLALTDGSYHVWMPTMQDMLAEDWVRV